MWKILGEEYRVGDSILIASGLFQTKIERYRIVKPRRYGGGWFGGGGDNYARATNGCETVRIGKRGQIVDDIIRRRRVVKYEEGIASVLEDEAEVEAELDKLRAQIPPLVQSKLDEAIFDIEKVRILAREGFDANQIAALVMVRRQLVHEVIAKMKLSENSEPH